MTLILVTVLAFLLLLGLTMAGFLWYMKAVAGILIVRKHEELERITANHDIPEQWTARHNERIIRLHRQGNLEKSRKLQEAARRSYIRKLKRLTHYLRKTRLVDSEETRAYTLLQLESVRMKWEEQSSHG